VTTTIPDDATIDGILTAQLAVAWAGEGGEEPRLGWWRSDFVSEFGGEDLFKRLLPHTWSWAVLEAAREAARRHDAERRQQAADPDQLITLFRLGFTLDERLDDRLLFLKRHGQPPFQVLPALKELLSAPYSKPSFEDWLRGHGDVDVVTEPAGRRVKAEAHASPALLVKKLVAALHPCPSRYPLPHARKAVGG